jgi:16S rRNA G1207 methylase RsmC
VSGSQQQRDPQGQPRERLVRLDLPDLSFPLVTMPGVFGAQRVDRGTVVLLRNIPAPGPCTAVVDLGTG